MHIKPVNRVTCQPDELGPLLYCQREFDMLRAGIRYSHEYAPEEHVDTAVEHVKDALQVKPTLEQSHGRLMHEGTHRRRSAFQGHGIEALEEA